MRDIYLIAGICLGISSNLLKAEELSPNLSQKTFVYSASELSSPFIFYHGSGNVLDKNEDKKISQVEANVAKISSLDSLVSPVSNSITLYIPVKNPGEVTSKFCSSDENIVYDTFNFSSKSGGVLVPYSLGSIPQLPIPLSNSKYTFVTSVCGKTYRTPISLK